MSTQNDASTTPEPRAPKPARRLQTNVRTLIALIACCAAIFWTWRRLSDNSDPTLVEARSIQARAIDSLHSTKPAERVTAIQELERLQDLDRAAALPPLTAALDDPDAGVRLAATQAVEWIAPAARKAGSAAESVRATAIVLIGHLKDPDQPVRLAAFKALGFIGDSFVQHGSDPETVRAAANALSGFLTDQDPGVRAAAVASLGRIASPRMELMGYVATDYKAVMVSLVEMLGDRDTQVRLTAIQALASPPWGRGDPPKSLMECLKDESPDIRSTVIQGLLMYRQGLDPWLPHLLRLAESDPDPKVREHCWSALNFAFHAPAITAAAFPDLVASLKRVNPKIRSQATVLLRELKADAQPAIPELLRILIEPVDPSVRSLMSPDWNFDPGCAAAHTLGKIAPESAQAAQVIKALTEVMHSGPEMRGGWAAIGLREFGPAAEEAIPELLKMASENNPDNKFERRSSAAIALGKIAPKTPSADQAVSAIRAVLECKDSMARESAINALREFGWKAAPAIPRIRELKDDRDASVRNAAAKALPVIEK
jgi:HEAT repeat protein